MTFFKTCYPQGSDSWVVELALWNILFQSGWYPILSLSSFPLQSSFLSPLWALWLLFRTDLWSINNIKTNYLIWKDKILVEERIHTEWPAFIDKCQFRGYWDCNFYIKKSKKFQVKEIGTEANFRKYQNPIGHLSHLGFNVVWPFLFPVKHQPCELIVDVLGFQLFSTQTDGSIRQTSLVKKWASPLALNMIKVGPTTEENSTLKSLQ